MSEPPKEFMDVVKRIPATWTCCKCDREFFNGPFSKDQPYGFETVTTEDGWRRRGGDICSDCWPNPTNRSG